MLIEVNPYLIILLMALLNVVLYLLFLLARKYKPLSIYSLYFCSTVLVFLGGCVFLYPLLKEAWGGAESDLTHYIVLRISLLAGALVVNAILISLLLLIVKLLNRIFKKGAEAAS